MGAAITSGDVLLGKYCVERVLGKGGMGTVVLARHQQLDERVAIKLLDADPADDAPVQRFVREARAAAKLRSEHVARVSDVGVLDSGAPYMVLEYLEGVDLAQLLTARGRLGAGEAVDLVLQALIALAEAHSHGLIHRDIKPSNLFLTQRPDGSPLLKVLDFGIAKSTATVTSTLTTTQALLGTPLYMSPEQMRSTRQVDHRADLWSIGVVLYELVSGSRPFDTENFAELCVQVATEPPPPLRADLPAGLVAVIDRCLDKNPDRRPTDAGQLARMLAPFAGRPDLAQVAVAQAVAILERADAVTRRERRPPPSTAIDGSIVGVPPSTLGMASGQMQQVPRRGRRTLWLAGAGVAAIGLAIAAFTLVQRTGEPAPAGPPRAVARPAPAPPPVVTERETASPAVDTAAPAPVAEVVPDAGAITPIPPAADEQTRSPSRKTHRRSRREPREESGEDPLLRLRK